MTAKEWGEICYKHGYEDREKEIIRCKDCKYEQYRHYSRFCINENGKCYGLEVTEDFYCADGERREENE